MATDYKALATAARTAQATPLGDMNEDVALVTMEALKAQDIATLKLIKADFPTQWAKYYQKGKNGHHYWNKEGYAALQTLINGELSTVDDL